MNNPSEEEDISNVDHATGRAKKTQDGDGAAIKLFEFWLKVVKHKAKWKIDEVTSKQIENTHLQLIIVEFVHWLRITNIPKNWILNELDEMIPPASHTIGEPVHMLLSSTLSKYVGRIIGFFRRKFPSHPDFEKLDPKNEQAVPAWWTSLRPKFEKDGGRKQKNKSSDCIYGGPNIRPLYFKCSDTPMIASDAEIADFVSSIDLRSILKKLMVKATITHAKLGPMQQRAILAVLLQAAGRAGEPKFVDINNWVYDPRWQVTDILWFEPKTSTIQTMPMLVSKGEYEACFYHSLGSYWACEAGLSRDTSQTDIESFLFPAFHERSQPMGLTRLLLQTSCLKLQWRRVKHWHVSRVSLICYFKRGRKTKYV